MSDTATKTKTIRTDYLARVEGEGGMRVRMRGDQVLDVQLKIYEPPRFFEAFLRGRQFSEAPDITARICGICPVAYQMSSCLAMESLAGAEVSGQLRALRRLLYCGEWIESHTLHIFMLHAPDFLGVTSAVELAKINPELVETALRLKKIGNEVMRVVGGREVHPINVKVGGWYKTPSRAQLEALVPDLEWAKAASLEAVRVVAGLEFPELEQDYEFVALDAAGEYPIDRGNRLVSTVGLDIPISEFFDHVVEEHVEHSNALHARLRERGSYLVGPLARYALHRGLLSPDALAAADEVGLDAVVRNPFRSIVVRAVELVHACDEALRLIAAYEEPPAPAVEVVPQAGWGHGASEAPRGVLYHRYRLGPDGGILDAKIVPPTSQNQRSIEEDLFAFVSAHAALPEEELRLRCEQTIRNYDPCISCATHFLTLEVERE
ncbi:MAG TPA: nickel-dependent hydrogenase large subunit [Gaiellaceae bacterium]|nr:nickel-dependent hydrogenase large subunit [Gaiellaceae bacterium]